MVLLSCACAAQVRDKQDSLRACMEDLANLTDHYNSVRAAKEMAQKELAKIKRQVEEARHDWTRKIRERRAEVRAVRVTGQAGADSAQYRSGDAAARRGAV
jgi:chromosome segregation ATPase